MLTLFAIPILAAVIGYALGFAAIHLKVEGNPIVEEIAALLPNGQCGQCGFPGCGQAALAMAEGNAAPNCCPPGGQALGEKIAAILGVSLDAGASRGPMLAAIDMAGCDGCGRSFKACTYDAIVGTTRQMQGVIADACTGCGACVSVCPHNGIALYPDPQYAANGPAKPQANRQQGVHHA